MAFVRGRGRAGLRGDEYGDEASVSMSSGKPERHAERSPPPPPRGAPRRPCSVKSSVPIFDADEAITCGERGKRRDEHLHAEGPCAHIRRRRGHHQRRVREAPNGRPQQRAQVDLGRGQRA